MIQYKVTIPFKEGLHARPASELVKACMKIKSSITLSKGDAKVNPKGILGIMSLGAAYGDEVSFSIEGEDEETAVMELKKFFES